MADDEHAVRPDALTLTKRQVLDLLDAHGIRPSRALGQNFVTDPNTVRRIVRLATIAPGDRVLEIGPGLGSLTLALLEAGADITAVEIDRYLVPVLRSVVEGRGVQVVQADALALNWAELLGPRPGTWVVVANLPYNIATPLVLDLLALAPQVERLVVMTQLEAAQRLAAGPGTKAYGIPSVKRAWFADARILGKVPATVFVPQPKVDSALIELRRRAPPEGDRETVFALVEAGFGHRRKMLRSTLAEFLNSAAFVASGIDPTLRGEALGLQDWCRLAAAIAPIER